VQYFLVIIFKKNINQFKEEDIQLQTSTGTIYGTVTLPKRDTTVPVVLIIAGSGPTDRNCISADGSIKSNSYYRWHESCSKGHTY